MDIKPRTTTALFTDVGLLIKSRMQKAMPMPLSQCQTLGFVAEHTNPSMQDVARYFNIRAPSATFLVDELVRGNYLERRSNTKDRRRVELTLTDKGKKCFKAIQKKREQVLGSLFDSLPPKDRKEMDRILEKIISNA